MQSVIVTISMSQNNEIFQRYVKCSQAFWIYKLVRIYGNSAILSIIRIYSRKLRITLCVEQPPENIILELQP